MIQQTLSKLKVLKLQGMAEALQANLGQPAFRGLSFDEQIGILVDSEVSSRDSRRWNRLLKSARLRYPSACLEDVDFRESRGLDKGLFAVLATCDWGAATKACGIYRCHRNRQELGGLCAGGASLSVRNAGNLPLFEPDCRGDCHGVG